MTVLTGNGFQPSSTALAAAFSTTVVAMVVIILGSLVATMKSSHLQLTPNEQLAIGLSLCAGGTVSLSFHELSTQTIDSFLISGFDRHQSYLFAALSMLLGVILVGIIQKVASRAVSGVINELDIMNNLRSPSNTPIDDIPRLSSNSSEHFDIKLAIQLRRIVYVACSTIFALDIPIGMLLYNSLTRKLPFSLEVQLGIILTNTILVHFPFGIVIGLPTFQLTSSRKSSVLYAACTSFGVLIGCISSFLFIDPTNNLEIAIVTGISVGMLVCFLIREILSTASFLDPTDKWVSTTTLCSMVLVQALFALSNYSIKENVPFIS